MNEVDRDDLRDLQSQIEDLKWELDKANAKHAALVNFLETVFYYSESFEGASFKLRELREDGEV